MRSRKNFYNDIYSQVLLMYKVIKGGVMFKKILILPLLCMFLVLQGCESEEISLVKNTPLPDDRGITYGELFDNYKHCENGEWNVVEDSRGRTAVEFSAKYLNLSVLKFLYRKLPNINEQLNSLEDIADYLDSNNINIELVATFLISSDSKQIDVPFIRFKYENETKFDRGAIIFSIPTSYIQSNHPIDTQFLADMEDRIHYYIKKFIITNYINMELVKATGLVYKDGVYPDEKTPIFLVKAKQFEFNDEAYEIDAIFKYYFTDLTPEKAKNLGITSSNIFSSKKYSVIQEGELKLALIQNDFPNNFAFSTFDPILSFNFMIEKLNEDSTIKAATSMAYEFKLPEEIQAYIKSEKEKINAEYLKKRNEDLKKGAYRGNPFVVDEPYRGNAAKKR